jgi:hypothetical protein
MAVIYDELGNVIGDYGDGPDEVSSAGTTQAGSSGTDTNEFGIGVRQYNPLSLYSSYTYQLSLYMISPDAYEEFNNTGRKNIFLVNDRNEGGGGAYLIAQSGGIEDPSVRAPGFHFDYFIDNLVINSAVNGASTGGPTTNVDMTFNITEAYGLSFITNLKRAKDALDQYSATTNFKDSQNASKQFFILGIKFLGYDPAGRLITQSSYIDERLGGSDPTFQRFYNIEITELKFKIDGKTTVYNIKATHTEISGAIGQKRGIIDKGANQLTGNTVGDILDKLMAKVTKDQEALVKSGDKEFATTYKVEYFDDAQEIAASTIVSSADVSKIKWPMAEPSDKSTVNSSLEIKAQPNSKERTMAFNGATPIIQAITSVIKQSDYLVNGLKEVYTTEESPDAKTNSNSSEKIDSKKRLKWFTVMPKIEDIKFDRKSKDWVYNITYQVKTYEIPILKSAYADKTTPYYGAVKRYEYWWTGQNSEIVKYEQTMNNTYFTVALSGDSASSASTGGKANIPLVFGKRQKADRLGKLDVGMEAQNSVVTDLYDPGAWADAKIEILGDPDWLANPEYSSGDAKSFYGNDGYTIQSNSGQIFIEIKFLEAVDYNNSTGVMNINDKLMLWDYPVKVAEQLNGAISYQVKDIKHMFRGGKFTQEINMAINTFPDVDGLKMSEQMRETENKEYADTENQQLQNRSTGLTTDPPPSSGSSGESAGIVSPEELSGDNNG